MGVRGRWVALVTVLAIGAAEATVHARRNKTVQLSEVVTRLRETQQGIVAAERAAVPEPDASEAELARRLVAGQLRLADDDFEGAAVVFLDLVENHAGSQAAPQAVYYLGEALMKLDMPRWAAEVFTRNLGDSNPAAQRFHQRSVARLFDLRHPPREEGFAEHPGTSATPEARARLAALGHRPDHAPRQGVIAADDAERLERWAESFAAADRIPELRYAYGRYLYLAGKHARARDELDTIALPGAIDNATARSEPHTLRAAYIAAAASLALGEVDDALERFSTVVRVRPPTTEDRRIVELAWMALGRVRHDQGKWSPSIRAYRRVGRDSPYFREAMYETAWTLLRAGHHQRAAQVLALLLVYDPQAPVAAEVKQLRGKIRISQRDYRAAEEDFLELRREYAALARQLEDKGHAGEPTEAWFQAVIGEDMRHFDLGTLLPAGAVPLARSLPRARQAEATVQVVGVLVDELRDTRALLARMEEALRAKEPARLFTDLNAHVAALDSAELGLLDIQYDLLRRAASRMDDAALTTFEAESRQYQRAIDQPLGPHGGTRDETVDTLTHLSEQVHKLQLTVAAQRAQLVAAERYYQETRQQQRIDHDAFLQQAAELRDAIAAADGRLRSMRHHIQRAESALRYDDPFVPARDHAVGQYRAYLARMRTVIADAAPDPETDELWERAKTLEQSLAGARSGLDRTAALRLRVAREVVVEERANLDDYLVQLQATRKRTQAVGAEVTAAAYRDVVAEVDNLVIRSEVGLLDVAWAMKEAEVEAVEHLEKARDQEMREIERNLELGLEALEP